MANQSELFALYDRLLESQVDTFHPTVDFQELHSKKLYNLR